MRIVLIGAVESTAVTLQCMIEAGFAPLAVVSLEADLAARHSDFVDMRPLAQQAGAEFITVRSINAPDVVARIGALKPDWLVIVGWSQIAHAPLLATAAVGTIGYHPSPLPELRGRAVLAWTIILGRTWTAGTLFALHREVDSGEILAQRRFDLSPRETLPTLIAKHMAALGEMWRELLPRLAAGPVRGRDQDPGLVSHCAKRVAEDGLIDWTQDASTIDRLVRAVTAPYPGAFTHRGGDKLMIWEAEPWTGPVHYGTPGQILQIKDDELLISCRLGEALHVRRWSWAPAADSPFPQRLRVGEKTGR